MASHQSNRKSSSALLVSSRPLTGIHRPCDTVTLLPVLIWKDRSYIRFHLRMFFAFPEENLEAQHRQCFGNKVTLCFEEEFSLSDAREWAVCFNQKSDIPLTIVDALPLALLVALFDVEDVQSAKSALLHALPLSANEVFTSVNDFTESLDPCNLVDFRHLVTVNIPHDTREFF